jgi:hypothetical protein
MATRTTVATALIHCCARSDDMPQPREQATPVALEDQMLILEPDGRVIVQPLHRTRWGMYIELVRRWWWTRR